MLKIQVVFKIRVVYKSGYTHDFECSQFSVSGTNKLTWTAVGNNKPVDMALHGTADIESVWQLGHRRRLVWR